MMIAQDIYNMVGGIISGTDAHEIFEEALGHPSPSGYEEIKDSDKPWIVGLIAGIAFCSIWNNSGEIIPFIAKEASKLDGLAEAIENELLENMSKSNRIKEYLKNWVQETS